MLIMKCIKNSIDNKFLQKKLITEGEFIRPQLSTLNQLIYNFIVLLFWLVMHPMQYNRKGQSSLLMTAKLQDYSQPKPNL